MSQHEAVATMPDTAETHLDQEHLAEQLGSLALAGETIDDTVNRLTPTDEALEAFFTQEDKEAAANKTRVHDIEAAHEAALYENDVIDAYKENELFDAHAAALKENDERKAEKIPAPDTEEQANESQPIAKPSSESAQALREEATVVLKQSGADTQLSPGSIVTKDAMGNLLILDGTDAKFITQTPDGRPKVTEYQYDDTTGTVSINDKLFSVMDHTINYEETSLKSGQTRDEILELPPIIAERFGIKRVIAKK
jgi:hypothetical protein